MTEIVSISPVSLREEERRRMASLLEKRLGQSLKLLQEQANVYQASLAPGGMSSYQAVQILAGMVGRVLAEFNDLAADLDPIDLDDLGLRPALENLAARMESRYGYKLTLDFSSLLSEQLLEIPVDQYPKKRVPSARLALVVYRIIQEALYNVGQHAGAGQVEVSLRLEGSMLRLTVADDGRGFQPPEPVDRWTGEGKWGLAEMAARAGEQGGRLEINSMAGVGSQVRAYLPLTARREPFQVGKNSGQETGLIEPLTARETEVLAGVAAGLTNKQIAAGLGISDRTVQYHLGNVLGKLGVASRTEAAVLAIQHGLVTKL
jgi:signal transduction histidine kinase/DNA-binding CsgD family transcriptional regulator